MTEKRGSLIRRLAQERQESPENATREAGAGLTLSLDGLLKDEKPALPIAPEVATPATAPLAKVEGSPTALEDSKTTLAPLPLPAPERKEPLAAVQAPAPAELPAEKRTHGPRLGRLPGRQRKRHGENCVRHPGEEKRSAGARAWLTPEESEKLELLATAYQVSTSTLTRDIILEGLAAHSELIEKTRRFLDSLGKGRVSA